MHVLLYRSRAEPGLLASDLNDIIITAQVRNRRLGVTGLLLHGRMEAIPTVAGEFVQWIEGPEDAIEDLFSDIEGDPRHFEVEVLAHGPVSEVVSQDPGLFARLSPDGRLFPTWSLGLVQLADLPATLSGFLRFASSWSGDTLSRAA